MFSTQMSQPKDASRMAGISAPKRKRSKVQLLLLDLQESYIYMTSKFFAVIVGLLNQKLKQHNKTQINQMSQSPKSGGGSKTRTSLLLRLFQHILTFIYS